MARSAAEHMVCSIPFGNKDANKHDEFWPWQSADNNLDDGRDKESDYYTDPRRKRYCRHTPQQIQEMESFFKEFPHPDENQRQYLSKKLGLSPCQVKFWFQNRRTQLKANQERLENVNLKQEIELLRAENTKLRDTLRNSICSGCGETGLDNSNSQQKGELLLAQSMSLGFRTQVDRTSSMLENPLTCSPMPPVSVKALPSLELGISMPATGDLNFANTRVHTVSQQPAVSILGIQASMFEKLAWEAMQELIQLCQAVEPMWIRLGSHVEEDIIKESLDLQEYASKFPARLIGPKAMVQKTEATRCTGTVAMKSCNIVENLLQERRWAERFHYLISSATTLSVLSSGINGTPNGTMLLMRAELGMLSPMIPKRNVLFLRYCKQYTACVWAVVDVSVDHLSENPKDCICDCRRMPSGCMLSEMPNGFTKVRWIEHMEYEDKAIPSMFRKFVSSGRAFGAKRWLSTLRSHCRKPSFVGHGTQGPPGVASKEFPGKRSLIKLAERMTGEFRNALMSSGINEWSTIPDAEMYNDLNLHFVWRKINAEKLANEPRNYSSLMAALSFSLPVPPLCLFDFLRDSKNRIKWDLSGKRGEVAEIARIQDENNEGNSISLLVIKGKKFMLQETSHETEGEWRLVYAPITKCSATSDTKKHERDDLVTVTVPSGFIIYSDDVTDFASQASSSLLTIAFQFFLRNPSSTISTPPAAAADSSAFTPESIRSVQCFLASVASKISSSLKIGGNVPQL